MTTLIAVIFTAFIGLGIPDSLIGSAWPAIYQELGVSSSLNYCVTMPITVCTIISSLLSGKLINKFGTGVVSAVSTLLTAIALILISYCDNLFLMALCGIPLGFGAGAIDSGLNGFTVKHYSQRIMNFLHCSYGVGVAISPYVIAFAIEKFSWRTGYRIAFIIQFVITAIIVISLPIWKKIEKKEFDEVLTQKKITTAELLKTRGLVPILFAFFFSCAIEFLFGGWLTTFLVNERGLLKETSAKILTVYYVGLTSGRFLSGVFSTKLKTKSIITIAFSTQIIATVLMFINTSNIALIIIISFLGGLGVGPIFPNLSHITPQIFGNEKFQRIMGLEYAASSMGILIFPFVYGKLSASLSHKIYPYFLAITLLFAICAALLLKKSVKERTHE